MMTYTNDIQQALNLSLITDKWLPWDWGMTFSTHDLSQHYTCIQAQLTPPILKWLPYDHSFVQLGIYHFIQPSPPCCLASKQSYRGPRNNKKVYQIIPGISRGQWHQISVSSPKKSCYNFFWKVKLGELEIYPSAADMLACMHLLGETHQPTWLLVSSLTSRVLLMPKCHYLSNKESS